MGWDIGRLNMESKMTSRFYKFHFFSRPDDAKTIQYLRLNMSNQIQKAAAILVDLSTS